MILKPIRKFSTEYRFNVTENGSRIKKRVRCLHLLADNIHSATGEGVLPFLTAPDTCYEIDVTADLQKLDMTACMVRIGYIHALNFPPPAPIEECIDGGTGNPITCFPFNGVVLRSDAGSYAFAPHAHLITTAFFTHGRFSLDWGQSIPPSLSVIPCNHLRVTLYDTDVMPECIPNLTNYGLEAFLK